MKDFEKIVESLDICANTCDCSKCAYENAGNGISCFDVLKQDALALIKELKAQLEQPTTECDSEIIAQSHSEEIRKLHDELCRVNVEYERTQRELYEAQKELTTLRAIKSHRRSVLGGKD